MARQIYGVHPLIEVLRAKPHSVRRIQMAAGAQSALLADVGDLAREAGIRIERVDRVKLDKLAPGAVHQGVMADLTDFEYAQLEDVLERKEGDPPLLLVLLDGIEDPQNLGAIIRSAYALGAHGVIIPQDRATGVTPVVVKASAGAIEHVPVVRVVNLTRAIERVKESHVWTAAAVLDGDRAPWDLDLAGPSALVFGGEGRGVRPLVAKACDFKVRIPMSAGFGALNASAAGAAFLYEALRQRTIPKASKPKPG